MKKITHKRTLLLGIFCILFSMILIPAPQAHAASQKTKAIKAYKKMLSQKMITWNPNWKVPAKNCDFTLVYVDKDSVPELVLQNTTDIPHAGNWGNLYTYYKGKVRLVTALDLNNNFYYYKKKGVFLDNYFGMGISENGYFTMSKAKATKRLHYTINTNPNAVKKNIYSKAAKPKFKEISKKSFNKELKKLVGSTKRTTAKFYKNTATNRKKRLK